MATNDRATQREILEAMVGRLRASVPDFTEATCFLSDQPTPVTWPTGGDVIAVVSLGAGLFPEAFYGGGGISTLCKSVELQVTIWVPTLRDAAPSFEYALTNEHGLYSRWEAEVLRALLVDVVDGKPQVWQPKGADGKGLLRNSLQPRSTTGARMDQTQTWMGMTISFQMDFDWRL